MKEMNRFIITDLIIGLLKVLVSFICRSYTILISSLYDLEHIIIMIFSKVNKNNNKLKGLLTSIISFLFILGTIGLTYICFTSSVKKPSVFIALFIILFILVKYAVSCFLTNINYSKKSGILSISSNNSNIDFYLYGVMLISMIVSKCSGWFNPLKYADKVGVILIGLVVVIKALKDIVSSFKCMENKELDITDDFKEEITKRKEIKSLDKIDIKYFGGYSYITCEVAINENISMLDINTFMVTFSDYILKLCDVAIIKMTNGTRKVKTIKRVRANARNSGSRNSKTSTKKKNTRKTNKKR